MTKLRSLAASVLCASSTHLCKLYLSSIKLITSGSQESGSCGKTSPDKTQLARRSCLVHHLYTLILSNWISLLLTTPRSSGAVRKTSWQDSTHSPLVPYAPALPISLNCICLLLKTHRSQESRAVKTSPDKTPLTRRSCPVRSRYPSLSLSARPAASGVGTAVEDVCCFTTHFDGCRTVGWQLPCRWTSHTSQSWFTQFCCGDSSK